MPFTAFLPMGPTALIVATSSTASSPIQVSTGGQQGMLLTNMSTIPIYVAYGSSSVQAACPTTGVPCLGLCLPVSAAPLRLSTPAGWLSAATSAGSASLFATPGGI